MATGRPPITRQHLATLWLVANCAIVLVWAAVPDAWVYVGCLLIMAWPFAALGLLVAMAVWPVALRRRLLAIGMVLAGAAVGWESPRLGPLFHVWWRQDAYLEQAHAALASPPPDLEWWGGGRKVDPSDSPPVRVAFFWFWFAAHGDVDGIVYDPTGRVTDGRQEWLFGAHAWHMFGPWYRFMN